MFYGKHNARVVFFFGKFIAKHFCNKQVYSKFGNYSKFDFFLLKEKNVDTMQKKLSENTVFECTYRAGIRGI